MEKYPFHKYLWVLYQNSIARDFFSYHIDLIDKEKK